MDYIFFAINALAAGFSVLLLVGRFLLAGRTPYRLWHYLASFAVVVFYYSLDSLYLSRNLTFYYIGNILPIAVLVISLVLALRQSAGTEK